MARIHISNDPSGRIIVSFPYDPLLVSKVKTIESRRWHPAEKQRSFPDSNGILEKILKVFGSEKIYLAPDLQANFPKIRSPEYVEGSKRSQKSHPTLKGTVPDLRTEQSVVVESGLSPQYEQPEPVCLYHHFGEYIRTFFRI
jgi:hypothetical protein